MIARSSNNGEDSTDGVRWLEVYVTYLHGRLLPKNPWLTDHLIWRAPRHRNGAWGPRFAGAVGASCGGRGSRRCAQAGPPPGTAAELPQPSASAAGKVTPCPACASAVGEVMRIIQPLGTLEVTQLAVVINDYISRKLVQDATLLPLANAKPPQETGVLDSLSLLRRVLFVQERFGIVMDDADLVPEHLASVDTLCAYVRSRAERTTRQGGGHG